MNYYGVQFQHNKALCPFHKDNNPSFMLKPQKNIVTCFSCGVTGNVISIVQKYEKLINHNPIKLNEAIKKIVEICNLDIDISSLKNFKEDNQYVVKARKYSDEDKKLLDVNKHLADLFHYCLVTPTELNKDGNIPLEYLHSRNISDEMIKELKLGFIPKGTIWKIYNNPNSKITKDQLQELGFIRKTESGAYEAFQDRIVFPICDEKGNIISFSGRTITEETPKYLLPTDNKIFHKRELLYNFNYAKNFSYNDEIILVEGYMDVVGAKKLGFENVAAIMGTALTEEQLNLIRSNRSSITLALDNDYNKNENVGRKAMLDKIPELLKKNIKVSVIDISKFGDIKDFGDLGDTELTMVDILKQKQSGFSFLLEYKYFENKNYDPEVIHDVFKQLKKDGLVKNTLDESMYKKYLESHTNFTKTEMDGILYPKSILEKEDTYNSFTVKAISNFLYQQVKQEASNRKDKVLLAFFESNPKEISDSIIKLFESNPSTYLLEDQVNINVVQLLNDYLKDNKTYSDYESLNRFTYVNVFDETYIKNVNGSAKVTLTDYQKQQVIKQFEETLENQDKLSLEEVEELYIVNSMDDIDGILPFQNKTAEIFRDNIKEFMFLNRGKMSFFKYGNLLSKEEKEFVLDSFKGKNGNYKTILLYNNLDNALSLDKNNITPVIEESKEPSPLDIEEDKTTEYRFSINKMLLVREFETETHYFVRIPATEAKKYFYIPKEECEWVESGEIFYTTLRAEESYDIYNRSGEFLETKSYHQLKHYWDDKTKTEENSQKDNDEVLEKNEKTNSFSNSSHSPKNPYCKVYHSRMHVETEKGFYFKTNDPKVLIFADKKICNWNEDKSYLTIEPRKGAFSNTGLSKYSLDGYKKTYEGKLSFKEIGNYLKVFYPQSQRKNILSISVNKEKCSFNTNFIHIPLEVDDLLGYIKANIIKTKMDNENVILELEKNEQVSFYSEDGKYVKQYDMSKIYNAFNQMKNKIIEFPSQNIEVPLEREVA